MRPFKFKLGLTYPLTDCEVYNFHPGNFKYEPLRDSPAYTIAYGGKLEFRGTEFTAILAVDQLESESRCNPFNFEVWRLCDGVYELFWKAQFTGDMCDWDLDACTALVTPIENQDVLACLNKGTEVNMLEAPTAVTAKAIRDYNNTGTTIARVEDAVYDNCRPFAEVLEMATTFLCSGVQGIISDFFQINPLVASDTLYTTGSINRYKEMVFAAKSDVLFPAAANATNEPVSWIALAKDLFFLFEVQWYLDANFYLHIEHKDYFAQQIGLDLTTPQYAEYLKGMLKYSYEKETVVTSETWTLPDSDITSTGTVLVKESKITLHYNNACATLANTITRDYRLELISTSHRLLFALANAGDQDKITDQGGVVLLSCTYNVGLAQYEIYGGSWNSELQMPALIHQIHRHSRPLLHSVTVDMSLTAPSDYPHDNPAASFDTVFGIDIRPFLVQTTNRYRRGGKITIPYCCDIDFNPMDLVKTPLGLGKVKSGSFEQRMDLLNLDLLYRERQPAAFDPVRMTDLDLCLIADYGIDTSGGGFKWNDARTNGVFASQATAGEQPTVVADALSGKQAVLFDGVDDGLKISGLDLFQASTGCAVLIFRLDNPPAGPVRMQLIGTAEQLVSTIWDLTLSGSAAAGYELMNYSSDAPFPTPNTLGQVRHLLGRSAENNYYYDRQWFCCVINLNPPPKGFEFTSVNGNYAGGTTAFQVAAGHDIHIGRMYSPFGGGAHEFKGKMGSIFIFRRNLTLLEIQKFQVWAQSYYKINMSIKNYLYTITP